MSAEIEVYKSVITYCEERIARKRALIESKLKKDLNKPTEESEQDTALSPEEPQPQSLAADLV